MSKSQKGNQNYDKEEIKNRREKNKEKRRQKREIPKETTRKSDYRRRKQHDREESKWDY